MLSILYDITCALLTPVVWAAKLTAAVALLLAPVAVGEYLCHLRL